jgi:hypothetical protein
VNVRFVTFLFISFFYFGWNRVWLERTAWLPLRTMSAAELCMCACVCVCVGTLSQLPSVSLDYKLTSRERKKRWAMAWPRPTLVTIKETHVPKWKAFPLFVFREPNVTVCVGAFCGLQCSCCGGGYCVCACVHMDEWKQRCTL